MTGRWRTVSRLLSVVALLAVLATGCGSAAQTHRSARHGIPRLLAQRWEDRASAVAAAATAGDDCQALHLASVLRDDVVAAQREVPLRLRSPLLADVKALAGRITCTPPPPVVKPKKAPKPPKPPHEDHAHHGHHKHDGGEGGDQ
jgi:hypothetical protein